MALNAAMDERVRSYLRDQLPTKARIQRGSEFMVWIFAWYSVIRIHTALFTPLNHSGRGYMSYNFMFVALRVNCGTGLIYPEQIDSLVINEALEAICTPFLSIILAIKRVLPLGR